MAVRRGCLQPLSAPKLARKSSRRSTGLKDRHRAPQAPQFLFAQNLIRIEYLAGPPGRVQHAVAKIAFPYRDHFGDSIGYEADEPGPNPDHDHARLPSR